MADVLRDAIAVATAAVDNEVGEPVDPLNYGKDVFCQFDVTPRWDTVDGDDPIAVVNASFRRLITDRGTLLDNPDYGYDLRRQWNQSITDEAIDNMAIAARAEVKKDDRVIEALITIVRTDERELDFTMDLTLEDIDGIFSLTFRLSERGVELT